MPRHISDERKAAFYIGTGLMIVGFLLFASTFVTLLMRSGEFDKFPGQVMVDDHGHVSFHDRGRSEPIRAFGGMALMMIGGFIRSIGARGLAGSGVLLDPETAREELEPYSRMTGGMVKDVLDEADINLGSREPTEVIKIKCRSCGGLNQETAKFCQECGTKL